jgi:hypothetical protein
MGNVFCPQIWLLKDILSSLSARYFAFGCVIYEQQMIV